MNEKKSSRKKELKKVHSRPWGRGEKKKGKQQRSPIWGVKETLGHRGKFRERTRKGCERRGGNNLISPNPKGEGTSKRVGKNLKEGEGKVGGIREERPSLREKGETINLSATNRCLGKGE